MGSEAAGHVVGHPATAAGRPTHAHWPSTGFPAHLILEMMPQNTQESPVPFQTSLPQQLPPALSTGLGEGPKVRERDFFLAKAIDSNGIQSTGGQGQDVRLP